MRVCMMLTPYREIQANVCTGLSRIKGIYIYILG